MEQQELNQLQEIVDNVFSVSIKSKSRHRNLVNARMVFSKIARGRSYGYCEIGRFLGKNHATIIHYTKNFDIYCMTDDELLNNYILCNNMMGGEFDELYVMEKDKLRSEIVSLKEEIISLHSELLCLKLKDKSDEKFLDIFNIVRERTKSGTEGDIKRKLNTFYNGVYDY